MKEKTNIRHKLENGTYCLRTLDKELWGNNDLRLTCMKCGFVEMINIDTFLKWQYHDEVTE